MILAGRSYYEYYYPVFDALSAAIERPFSLVIGFPSLRSLIDKKNQLDPLSDCDVISQIIQSITKIEME